MHLANHAFGNTAFGNTAIASPFFLPLSQDIPPFGSTDGVPQAMVPQAGAKKKVGFRLPAKRLPRLHVVGAAGNEAHAAVLGVGAQAVANAGDGNEAMEVGG